MPRPVKNSADILTVDVGASLIRIIDVDEKVLSSSKSERLLGGEKIAIFVTSTFLSLAISTFQNSRVITLFTFQEICSEFYFSGTGANRKG